MNNLTIVPDPPRMSDWAFIDQFKKYPRTIRQGREMKCPVDQVDLSGGIQLSKFAEDTGGLLDTAYNDFSRFLTDIQLPADTGHQVNFILAPDLPRETFILDVRRTDSVVKVADIEAARRAIYFLMNELVSSEGTFLPVKTFRREPFVKIRISRCYFGPKKRPPLSKVELMTKPGYKAILANDPEYRDELVDGFDYFPEAYLSRLARDGINGIWLVGYFNELCKSEIIPEYGEDSDIRLKRLREIVEKCGRYGIKVYIFCMEPIGFGERVPIEILHAHPELKGNHAGSAYYFCTSTEAGQAYLDESTYYLFSQVPGLGGLINLCVGERPTNCCSGYIVEGYKNFCPRCGKRKPSKVVSEVLAIMRKAMQRANPEAELIAWPYSQYLAWGEQNTVDAVKDIPEDVILIHNFESRGRVRQLNRERILDDYWLAYPGPSQLFKDCANAAIKNNIRFGAKIQTSCSYELATVPFVPVPGILYKKYRAMHELKVGTVMQNWLVGSCPSVMTQAAGILSCEPFPANEDEFLLKLAAIDWGKHAKVMASAWKLFHKAYENYPYARVFSYYSPMNAGIVWPLFLFPQDKELYPPFRANRPPCGDRIGECLMDEFTLEEAITLCGKMTVFWNQGLKLIDDISGDFLNDADRQKDIGVANAIGIQIRSAYNILTFYYLREEMAWCPSFAKKQKLFNKLREIVNEEIHNTKRLLELSENDSRLGFQADSECHVYYPAKIKWRLRQLEQIMAEEFPVVEAKISVGEELFPEYTGKSPGENFSYSKRLSHSPAINDEIWSGITPKTCNKPYFDRTADTGLTANRSAEWRSCYTAKALFIKVQCVEPDIDLLHRQWELPDYQLADCIELVIEKQRLWTPQKFVANTSGETLYVKQEKSKDYQWAVEVEISENQWSILFCLPWEVFGFSNPPSRPLRLNVKRIIPDRESGGYCAQTWCGYHPMIHRILQQNDNPADFGWLFLAEK